MIQLQRLTLDGKTFLAGFNDDQSQVAVVACDKRLNRYSLEMIPVDKATEALRSILSVEQAIDNELIRACLQSISKPTKRRRRNGPKVSR